MNDLSNKFYILEHLAAQAKIEVESRSYALQGKKDTLVVLYKYLQDCKKQLSQMNFDMLLNALPKNIIGALLDHAAERGDSEFVSLFNKMYQTRSEDMYKHLKDNEEQFFNALISSALTNDDVMLSLYEFLKEPHYAPINYLELLPAKVLQELYDLAVVKQDEDMLKELLHEKERRDLQRKYTAYDEDIQEIE